MRLIHTLPHQLEQAAFDQRVLASVCFFATDVHSASLGKGKSDDTLIKVRNGDLAGKGELVVSLLLSDVDPLSKLIGYLPFL